MRYMQNSMGICNIDIDFIRTIMGIENYWSGSNRVYVGWLWILSGQKDTHASAAMN